MNYLFNNTLIFVSISNYYEMLATRDVKRDSDLAQLIDSLLHYTHCSHYPQTHGVNADEVLLLTDVHQLPNAVLL